jgi:hypothetical protein
VENVRARLLAEGKPFYSLTERAVDGLIDELFIRGSRTIFESSRPHMYIPGGTGLAMKLTDATSSPGVAVVELTAQEAEAVAAAIDDRAVHRS